MGKACQILTLWKEDSELLILWQSDTSGKQKTKHLKPCAFVLLMKHILFMKEFCFFFSISLWSGDGDTFRQRWDFIIPRPVKFSAGKHIFKTISLPHTLMYCRGWNSMSNIFDLPQHLLPDYHVLHGFSYSTYDFWIKLSPELNPGESPLFSRMLQT